MAAKSRPKPQPKFQKSSEVRRRPHPRKRWKFRRGFAHRCFKCGISRPLAELTRLDVSIAEARKGAKFGPLICSDETGRFQKCGRY